MAQPDVEEPVVSPPVGSARLPAAVALISLVLLAASYVVNAMDRQVFPVLLTPIRAEYGFSIQQGGLLSTIFTLGIGLSGVPAGYLLDRLSRKSVMIVGILVYSGFTLLTAIATGFWDMLAFRALSGVGEALQNAALFSAVGAYFFARRAMALGSLNFAYGLGGFLGPVIGAQLAGNNHWRLPLVVYGLIGLAFCVVIAVGIRKTFTERQEVAGDLDRPADVAHVSPRLYNRNIVLLAVAAVVVGMSMYGYIGLYPTFLVTQLHWDSGHAAMAASMFGLGALLGIPAGWLGDRVNQRTLMIVSLVAGAVVGYLLFNGPTSTVVQYVLSFAEGAIASGFLFVNIYSAMQRAVRPHLIGRASGVYVSAFYVPAAFAGYLFSALVTTTGWGGAAIWQLTVLPLVGVVALLFLDTRRLATARVEARA